MWRKMVGYGRRSVAEAAISRIQGIVQRTSPLQEAWMDGLRAEDQGVHIQHAFESRNDVGN